MKTKPISTELRRFLKGNTTAASASAQCQMTPQEQAALQASHNVLSNMNEARRLEIIALRKVAVKHDYEGMEEEYRNALEGGLERIALLAASGCVKNDDPPHVCNCSCEHILAITRELCVPLTPSPNNEANAVSAPSEKNPL